MLTKTNNVFQFPVRVIVVGGYWHGDRNGIKIWMVHSKKPSAVHRFFNRVLLGWTWNDLPPGDWNGYSIPDGYPL